jgi:pyruvate kinase
VIVALTKDKLVLTRLTVYRGVYSVPIRQPRSFEDMLEMVETVGQKYDLVHKGDTVVITGGAPFGRMVQTNFMMYYKIAGKIS